MAPDLIGTRYRVPTDIAESGTIRVVGQEHNEPGKLRRLNIKGDYVYWCVEVRNGKSRGFAFAAGSEEVARWETA